jgi:glutaminyl-peptide cyclotransferase
MSLGPRTPGSPAHTQVIEWMKTELAKSGWTVETQDTTQDGQPVHNVIAKRGSGAPWTILGAHFDSRMKADHDPDPAKQNEPVPAANDGASGVAVLMELSRVLPKDLKGQVWLAFFDSEDQGDLQGWDWILGSRALANSLTSQPDAVIVIDMIGDADLNVYEEKNSDPVLSGQIWGTAAQLGYQKAIIPQVKYDMLDDHTPFLEKGIHAVDMIDFDNPYWHTTADTTDKTSAQSLKIIGDTLLHWLVSTQGS